MGSCAKVQHAPAPRRQWFCLDKYTGCSYKDVWSSMCTHSIAGPIYRSSCRPAHPPRQCCGAGLHLSAEHERAPCFHLCIEVRRKTHSETHSEGSGLDCEAVSSTKGLTRFKWKIMKGDPWGYNSPNKHRKGTLGFRRDACGTLKMTDEILEIESRTAWEESAHLYYYPYRHRTSCFQALHYNSPSHFGSRASRNDGHGRTSISKAGCFKV